MIRKRARKFETINDNEKLEIYKEWRSGNYYLKEILQDHHISRNTFNLCIEKFRGEQR